MPEKIWYVPFFCVQYRLPGAVNPGKYKKGRFIYD
jgi:hypothetical protein